jgi:hypothetical protein
VPGRASVSMKFFRMGATKSPFDADIQTLPAEGGGRHSPPLDHGPLP